MKILGRSIPLVAVLMLAGVSHAVPPGLEIPDEVKPSGQYVLFSPRTDAVSVTYVGLSGLDPVPTAALKDARMFLLDTRGLAVGRYKFVAVGASKEGEQARKDFTVVIGEAPPVPPGPTPPGPNPPTPGGAFNRALIIYERADSAKLPPSQLNVLHGAQVREYLNSKCVTGPDGKTKEWNIWDKDDDASGMPKPWPEMMARPRKSLPWIVLANDKGVVFEGELPANVTDTMALLQKYSVNTLKKAG